MSALFSKELQTVISCYGDVADLYDSTFYSLDIETSAVSQRKVFGILSIIGISQVHFNELVQNGNVVYQYGRKGLTGTKNGMSGICATEMNLFAIYGIEGIFLHITSRTASAISASGNESGNDQVGISGVVSTSFDLVITPELWSSISDLFPQEEIALEIRKLVIMAKIMISEHNVTEGKGVSSVDTTRTVKPIAVLIFRLISKLMASKAEGKMKKIPTGIRSSINELMKNSGFSNQYQNLHKQISKYRYASMEEAIRNADYFIEEKAKDKSRVKSGVSGKKIVGTPNGIAINPNGPDPRDDEQSLVRRPKSKSEPNN